MEQQGADPPAKVRHVARKMARFAPNPLLTITTAKPAPMKKQQLSAAKITATQKLLKTTSKNPSDVNLKILPKSALGMAGPSSPGGTRRKIVPKLRKMVASSSVSAKPISSSSQTSSPLGLINPPPPVVPTGRAAPEVRPPENMKVEIKTEVRTRDGQIFSWISTGDFKNEQKEEENEDSVEADVEDGDGDYLLLTDHHRSLLGKGCIQVMGRGPCSVPDKSGQKQYGYFVEVFDKNNINETKHLYFLPQDRIPSDHQNKFEETVRRMHEG